EKPAHSQRFAPGHPSALLLPGPARAQSPPQKAGDYVVLLLKLHDIRKSANRALLSYPFSILMASAIRTARTVGKTSCTLTMSAPFKAPATATARLPSRRWSTSRPRVRPIKFLREAPSKTG